MNKRFSYRAACVSFHVLLLWGLFSPLRGEASSERSAEEPFQFVQLCDTQLGRGGYERSVKTFQQAVTQINELAPDFVVLCGDMVDQMTEQSIADFKRIKEGFTVPCYLVPGNHDVGNGPTVESLEFYRGTFGRDYYSFEHKGYRFVFVNTQLWRKDVEGESTRQDAWLKTALESASADGLPIFVIGHYPLYDDDIDEERTTDNLPPAKRKELLDLFEEYGVVAMLTGHAHRLIVNAYKGIQLVTGVSTSRNQDLWPFGFQLWSINGQRPFKHELIPLEGFGKKKRQPRRSAAPGDR